MSTVYTCARVGEPRHPRVYECGCRSVCVTYVDEGEDSQASRVQNLRRHWLSGLTLLFDEPACGSLLKFGCLEVCLCASP